MDPVIPATIGTVLFVSLFLVLAWPALHWLAEGAGKARKRLMAMARERARATVEDDSGDQGAVRCKAYDEWVKKGGRTEFIRASRSARANRPQDF